MLYSYVTGSAVGMFTSASPQTRVMYCVKILDGYISLGDTNNLMGPHSYIKSFIDQNVIIWCGCIAKFKKWAVELYIQYDIKFAMHVTYKRE